MTAQQAIARQEDNTAIRRQAGPPLWLAQGIHAVDCSAAVQAAYCVPFLEGAPSLARASLVLLCFPRCAEPWEKGKR